MNRKIITYAFSAAAIVLTTTACGDQEKSDAKMQKLAVECNGISTLSITKSFFGYSVTASCAETKEQRAQHK